MKIIIGNQKNYLCKKETLSFIRKLKKRTWKGDVIICPSISYLSSCNFSDIVLGSQFFSMKHPFSSGVSVDQLKELKIEYCIIGHSDNRKYQNESDLQTSKKAKLLIENGINPIYCFGENEKFESDEDMLKWISEYALVIKKNLDKDEIKKIIFAYEPSYNINNSKTSNASLDIKSIDRFMSMFKSEIKKQCKTNIKLLYGGNANPSNVSELQTIKSLDGYLLGRASSDFKTLEKFVSIVNSQ